MFNPRLKYAIVFFAFAILIGLPALSGEPPKTTSQTSSATQTGTPQGASVPVVWNLACQLAGGTEFPTGFKVTNNGAKAVPKGTKLEWTANTVTGVLTLPADLLPAASYTFTSVTPGIPAGTACTMKVKQLPAMLKPAAVSTAKPVLTLKLNLKCVAQGSPVEFPDDIYLTNTGTTAIAKGTAIHWEFPNTGRKGDYTFTEDLGAGSSKMVSGVVGGGITAGLPCTVTRK